MKRVEEVKEGALFVVNTLPYVVLEALPLSQLASFCTASEWCRHTYSLVLNTSTYVYKLALGKSIKEYKEEDIKPAIIKAFYDE